MRHSKENVLGISCHLEGLDLPRQIIVVHDELLESIQPHYRLWDAPPEYIVLQVN